MPFLTFWSLLSYLLLSRRRCIYWSSLYLLSCSIFCGIAKCISALKMGGVSHWNKCCFIQLVYDYYYSRGVGLIGIQNRYLLCDLHAHLVGDSARTIHCMACCCTRHTKFYVIKILVKWTSLGNRLRQAFQNMGWSGPKFVGYDDDRVDESDDRCLVEEEVSIYETPFACLGSSLNRL